MSIAMFRRSPLALVDHGAASVMPAAPANVFLSYSHDSPEHAAKVKVLASQLQAAGLTVALDQAVAPEPSEGWSLWCRQHALYARTVLVVCSAQYKRRWEHRDLPSAGLGVGWEAHLLRAKFLHEEQLRNPRMRPVLLPGSRPEDVPLELRDWKTYRPLESADDMKELVDRIKNASGPESSALVAQPAPNVAAPSRPTSRLQRRTLSGVGAATAVLSAVMLTAPSPGSLPPEGLGSGHAAVSIGAEVIWVRVEGGTFMAKFADTSSPPGAERKVSVEPFSVSRHEITVRQYRECVESGNCPRPGTKVNCNWNIPGREAHPINCVSWYDAMAYANWSARQIHKFVRLPTEVEFEFLASRHGEAKYPWGHDAPTCERATLLFHERCATAHTSSVCSHESSTSVSLCDLIGNVWEWSSDWHILNINKIVRGGSWQQRPDDIDASTRHWREPTDQESTIGFRVAHSN